MDSKKYYDAVGELGSHKRELVRFEQTLPHIHPKESLVDVGCGEGYWLEFLQLRANLNLVGVDVSPKRLEIARKRLAQKDIKLLEGKIEDIPLAPNSVGQATALEVLEHVPNWEEGLQSLLNIANYRVVITVPYNETLKYETCKCGHQAPLYGHLHSFTEEDFAKVQVDGRMTFERFPPAFGSGHYIKRAVKGLVSRAQKISVPQENGHSLTTVCTNCYEEVPYTKYVERAIHRIQRIVTRSPEYLLVKVQK